MRPSAETLFIDLLELAQEERFLRDPEILARIVDGLPTGILRVVLDEVHSQAGLPPLVHTHARWRRNRPGAGTAGKGIALVEIESSDKVQPKMVKHLEAFLPDFKKAEAFLLSLDPIPQKMGNVRCLPWQDGLLALGL